MIYNLESIVSGKVHIPRVDNLPLYVRVDGGVDDEINKNKKTDKWESVSHKIYNSPDNVRRVFITHKGVYIQLYKSIKGLEKDGKFIYKKYDDNTKELISRLKASGGRYNLGEKRVDRLVGSGIGGICRSWVCSNIEEVYFDWVIFLSEDIKNMGYGDIYNEYIVKGIDIPRDVIEGIFKRYCLSSVSDIKVRYPRLRSYGYIRDLDKEMEYINSVSGSLKDELLAKELGSRPWYLNKLVAKCKVEHGVSLVELDKAKVKNDEDFSIKSNIYKYDRDILDGFICGYRKGLRDKRLGKDTKIDNEEGLNRSIDTKDSNKCTSNKNEVKIENNNNIDEDTKKVYNRDVKEFERLLDGLYEVGGIEGVKKGIQISLKGSGNSEEIYEELTERGKERYGKYINRQVR